MKRLFWIFLILTHAFVISAKDLKDRYIMRVIPEGYQFFILPFQIDNASKGQAALADVTILSFQPEITMNISAYSPLPLDIDSVCIYHHQKNIIRNHSIFFVEKDRKQWQHRISCRMLLSDFRAIYSAEQPYTIIIYSQQEPLTLQCNPKKWQQEQRWMNDILFVINKNR